MGDPDLAIELVNNYAAFAAVPIPPFRTRCLDVNIGWTNDGCSLVKRPVRFTRPGDPPEDVNDDIRTESGDGGVLGNALERTFG